MQSADYTIGEARYAKRMMAVRCPGKDGWMTRAGRLAHVIARGRYTHREDAYIMSPTKARKFETMYRTGWDGSTIMNRLEPPTTA